MDGKANNVKTSEHKFQRYRFELVQRRHYQYRTSNIGASEWVSIIKFYRNDFLSQMNSMSMHNIPMESFVNQRKRRNTEIERAASSIILVQCNMGLIFPSFIFGKHFDWINFRCNFIKWPRFKSFPLIFVWKSARNPRRN